jgi:hypothetical protein
VFSQQQSMVERMKPGVTPQKSNGRRFNPVVDIDGKSAENKIRSY